MRNNEPTNLSSFYENLMAHKMSAISDFLKVPSNVIDYRYCIIFKRSFLNCHIDSTIKIEETCKYFKGERDDYLEKYVYVPTDCPYYAEIIEPKIIPVDLKEQEHNKNYYASLEENVLLEKIWQIKQDFVHASTTVVNAYTGVSLHLTKQSKEIESSILTKKIESGVGLTVLFGSVASILSLPALPIALVGFGGAAVFMKYKGLDTIEKQRAVLYHNLHQSRQEVDLYFRKIQDEKKLDLYCNISKENFCNVFSGDNWAEKVEAYKEQITNSRI